MSDKRLSNCKEIGERREAVHSILRRYEDEALWDTVKARDVDPQILEHVQFELETGKSFNEIRRELGIRSGSSKAWQKIMAGIKAGWRVDSAGFVVRMVGRQEKIAGKLFRLIDTFLDQDAEKLKDLDEDGVPLLESYSKAITPMIDSLNRLHQGSAKIGKDLGVFVDAPDQKGGAPTQIIIQNNVPLPTPQQIIDAKVKKPDVVVKP